jgi:hypothetical protein
MRIGGTRHESFWKHKYTMSSGAVAREIVSAIETETYEVSLGAAANLYEKRDRMFPAINE